MGRNAKRRRSPPPPASSNGEQATRIGEVALPVIAEAVAIPADGGMTITQPPQLADSPRILVLDVTIGAWRPIMLPPGEWTLQAAEPPKPELWRP